MMPIRKERTVAIKRILETFIIGMIVLAPILPFSEILDKKIVLQIDLSGISGCVLKQLPHI